ncbi:acetylglutamate kinase [Thomasclavelia cocleata]|jgi:acetylglutamate kinase|uniref:Acetylglutamate kinase n=1 Tax=Thomasclavelia cocleata TaxID=69824 RepID=A0A1I0FXQ0_9FIRM|nr:acetylglutamate kinase [Thomasclavelia cocleata]MCI9130667.1 acetylglutamate kinase [Thomasclavelia cocleata]MCI9630626.1 acetylglutamate kinase [Thomasclavelia cocleata]MCR1961494.1 acetylglutamate kinase [Thomasclavelia cocleata]NDO42323.1 acetylglutamate kinase [Thomasclavelia cocleata]PJN80255.1 acetylglutamate kinase [Thomasclavelia cocleata]
MHTTEQNKAQVLVDALSYIQKFAGDMVVIKYGGSAMTNEVIKQSVLKDIAVLKSVGIKPVIVHGGGKDINSWLNKVEIKSEFKNGLRVTTKETLEVAEMVLSGKLNKGLVQHMERIGTHAVGLSGKDGNMLTVEKCLSKGEDIGYVGKITHVDTELIETLLLNGYTPIISTIGLDEKYHAYNINADDVATAIARALKASKLVFLTDIEGVLEDPSDPNTLISKINTNSAKQLFESGVIQGGMIPKLKNCIDAVQDDVKKVHILDGRMEHSLLIEIFTTSGVGTEIKK